MKIFLVRASPEPLDRQTTRGWLATNLVMPGLGSLAGGRKIGLLQLTLCLAGFAITLGGGLPFIFWALAHWSEFYGSDPIPDPLAPLRDLWQHARWPLLGMGLFALSWVWALLTSWSLLVEAKNKKTGG